MSEIAQDFDIVEPSASALVEAMRAFGYTPETALADLIDNSISANAQNVWITFYWNGSDSFIAIRDDGSGMTEVELTQAMRPGSRSPCDVRDPSDLGRFGLGLKTASFSQCRRLTVATKAAGENSAVRRWDLDYIAQNRALDGSGWRLLRSAAAGSTLRLQELESQPAGTIVLWENLDRLVGAASVDDERAQSSFYNMVSKVEEHLTMVFHRFLEGPKPRLSIFVNGDDADHRLKAWDPFLQEQLATWRTPPEPVPFKNGSVIVQGFVLPHKDRLEPALYVSAAGPKGWTAQQGFYVYRNGRLLVPGSWLSLGRPRRWNKDEQYKLARIQVDIPNDTDSDWQIDVKKSTARPPIAIRQRLRELAENIRKEAREVFVHRGSYSPRKSTTEQQHIWRPIKRDGRVLYRIDRKHVLVKSLASTNGQLPVEIEALLKWLEETVPIHQIWLDFTEETDGHARPFETVDEAGIVETMKRLSEAIQLTEKVTPEVARDRIKAMEPFRAYQHLIDLLPCHGDK